MGLICRSLSASASEADPVERPSLLLAIHGANVAARTTPFSHSSARPCPVRSLSYRPLPERSTTRYDSGSCCNRALLRLEAFYRRVDICERFPRPALREATGSARLPRVFPTNRRVATLCNLAWSASVRLSKVRKPDDQRCQTTSAAPSQEIFCATN